MSLSHPGQPLRSDLERTPAQAAREKALTEVAETLLNIEQAVERAERGSRVAARLDDCDDLVRVLDTAAQRLAAARKELFQRAYFPGGQPGLF